LHLPRQLGQLGNDFVEGSELTEPKLVDFVGCASVPIDHGTGAMASAVRYPCLGAPVCKGERYEGGAQIMNANGPPCGGLCKKIRPINPGHF